MRDQAIQVSVTPKFSTYVELLKVRLSALVAFSCAFGYLLANHARVEWVSFCMLIVGGFLLSGASVTFNQIIERDLDKLMKRTESRPLPTGRISIRQATIFGFGCFILAIAILAVFTNPITVLLSLVSFFLYVLAYTPLKRVGPIAVFVGAIPGALPPLLGWTAVTGRISFEALLIFGIQFIWQFPHFWAIAWVADDDYKRARFKLLPSGGGKDLNTALQITMYTLFLIPIGLLPAVFGITGINSAFVATLCGSLFFAQTLSLMRTQSSLSARRIMFGSFLYLPIIQISYLLDIMP